MKPSDLIVQFDELAVREMDAFDAVVRASMNGKPRPVIKKAILRHKRAESRLRRLGEVLAR